MGDLTKHFSYWEFRPYGRSKKWIPTGMYPTILLRALAKNLEVVRSIVNRPMSITSGVRNPAKDFERLKKKGYNPSLTSDHYCGYPVEIPKGTKKFTRYGMYYTFAVGAADVVPQGIAVAEFFEKAVAADKAGKARFGQIIYERIVRNNKVSAEWVHFGNDPLLVYHPSVVKKFRRTRYLKSLDGGKTYIPHK